MALLKFRCKSCARVFDELVSHARMSDVRCPDCGGETERAYEGRCQSGVKGECSGHCSGCGGCSHGN